MSVENVLKLYWTNKMCVVDYYTRHGDINNKFTVVRESEIWPRKKQEKL